VTVATAESPFAVAVVPLTAPPAPPVWPVPSLRPPLPPIARA